jgi:D-alanyl-D-alanine carboxypeptidase
LGFAKQRRTDAALSVLPNSGSQNWCSRVYWDYENQNPRCSFTRGRDPSRRPCSRFCSSPGQFPGTPAAHQFAAWLDAFNSGDRDALSQFLDKNFPTHPRSVDDEMNFRQRTGGFEFKKAEESTPTRFTGLVKERDSDQYARFEIEVAADEPHAITKMGLRAIPRPSDVPLPRMSETDALAALRTQVAKDAAADKFSGTVLVAKDGKPVFVEAYGLADREKKIPNTLDTRFRIGSMNKMFTAVCVLQLVQAGKINLTDPLGKYLPDYPNKDVASKVTIHQLLTHTGGTGDFFGPEFDKHRLELRTLEDYITLYGKRAPEFEPGSRWEYSNYGFLLLGVVVEKVSGQNYYDYVRDHVYKPAGMTSTGSDPEDQVVQLRSVGYTKDDGPGPGAAANSQWHPNTDTLPYRGTSAGGGYSTVGDLLRFANALEGHKLLDAHYTELLTTGKVDTPAGDKYAYGFGEQMRGAVRCFGHGGGAPGMNGNLDICPQSGYTVAVLANMDPPAAQRVSQFISNRLPDK